MTNVQLLLSIGIPSLLIVVSMLSNNARINLLDKSLGKRLDGHDDHLKQIDADIRELRAEHHRDLMTIYADMKEFYGMTTKLEGRVDEISKR